MIGRTLDSLRHLLRFGDDTSGIFAQVPIDLPGRLYASPMPFGPYDRHNRLMGIYRRHDIRWAAVLVTDDEVKRKAKRDPYKAYWHAGITPIRHPIADMTSPDMNGLSVLVEQIVSALGEGNVAVHCNAGVGRTGLVAACVVKRVRHCTTEQAMAAVAECTRINLTTEQRRSVKLYAPGSAAASLQAARS